MTVKLNKVVILIDGLTCSSCVSTVENALKDLKSVADVKVSLATNSCSLEYDSSILSIESILNKIENIGYTAKLLTQDHLQANESHPVVRELTLNVTGMTCSSCASTIETALSQLNGVERAMVVLATNSALVVYDPQKISSSAVIEEIDSNGYAATVIKDSFISSSEQGKKKKIKQLLVAVSLGNEISKETARLNLEQCLLPLECIAELQFPHATTHSEGTLLVQVQCNSIFVPSNLVTARMIQELPGCTITVVEETITEIAVETGQLIEKVKALLITFTIVDDHSVHDWPTFLSGYACELKMCVGVLSTEEMQEEAQVLVTFNELLTGPRAFFMVAQKVYAKFTNGSGDLAVDGFQISSVGGFMMADQLLKSQNKEMMELRNLFLVALILTMPVLVLAMILPLYPHNNAQETMEINVVSGLTLTNLIQFLLDSPIQWWIGFRFHRRAFFSLKRGTVGMDFIISTGTSAAYFYSLIAVIQQMVKGGRGHAMSDTYFEISAVLITVILLGKYLECYAKGRTASAIHKLSALKSNNARLVGIMPESFMLSSPSSLWPLPENEFRTFSDHSSKDSSSDILIDASFLHLYDVVRLVSGESVPGDGVLLSNSHISLDESLLTGESRIISKKEFDSVYGGTIVHDGSALMRITAIGDDSTLGKIIQTIQEAQISKPQIQELAEKFAKIFVPAVICISITTFVIWIIVGSLQIIPDSWDRTRGGPFLFAFTFALAVWVSACPCAFGLATPTAVLVATGVAAKNGILVRRGAALQSASEIDTMAFDKTGTLTRGHTEVTDYYFKASSQQILTVPCLDVFDADNDKENMIQQHGVIVRTQLQFLNDFWKSLSKQQLTEFYEHLLFLYFTEQKSNHPLALGVATYCSRMLENLEQYWLLTYGPSGESNVLTKLKDDCKHGIDEYQFEFIPGKGIHLFFNSSSTENDEPIKDRSLPLLASHCSDLVIGNPSLFASLNVQLPAVASEIANGLTAVGKVSLFYAVNGIWKGILSLSDKVRPEAVYVIRELQQRNISCFMVTGDQTGTANAIGSLLGIKSSHILSNAKPEDKEMFLAALHQKGAKVGFIGDGNNDGPALARAHVGIVMASGTDIAMESGDMVLCKNDLTALIACLDISRLTLRRIKLNYIWAFGYNCLLIPIAAGVFFPFFQFALQPMWAGAAMAVSSVSVIVSSLTITLFKPKSFVHVMESSMAENEGDLSKNHTCKCPISTIPVLDEQNKNGLFGKLNFTSWVPNLLTDDFLHSEKSATALLLEYKAQKLGLNEEDIANTKEHHSLKTVRELPCTCGAKNCRCSNQCNCGKQLSTVDSSKPTNNVQTIDY